MRCPVLAVLALAALALLATPARGVSVLQLDVCNSHRGVSELPSMTLSVRGGVCIVTSLAMRGPPQASGSGCSVSGADEALVLRFPCSPKEQSDGRKSVGPALNIWASVPHGMPTTAEAASAIATLRLPMAPHQLPPAASCNITTMAPAIYFHHMPPLFSYGYSLTDVPCERAVWRGAVSEQATNGEGFAAQFGMWIVPSLPAPPVEFSTEDQACHLVMTVQNHGYISDQKFRCNMVPRPTDRLGRGCCYEPPGARRLL